MRRRFENVRKFSMPSNLSRRCAGLFLLLASPVSAQEFRAVISGEVTDPSGAAVSEAKVTAVAVERNVPYEATTSTAGRYTIRFLLPGSYTVTVEKPGFRKFVREGVAL